MPPINNLPAASGLIKEKFFNEWSKICVYQTAPDKFLRAVSD